MKRIALLLTLLISTFHFSVFAQDMTLSKDSFEGNFVIDSTFTRDGGKTFEVSASGDAGPYGRVYLSYVFTDKQNLGTAGEFTGFAWTQNGENVVTATLQGAYVKQGKVFKMYTFDPTSSGKLNFATGIVDFVAKTMKFKVSEVDTSLQIKRLLGIVVKQRDLYRSQFLGRFSAL